VYSPGGRFETEKSPLEDEFVTRSAFVLLLMTFTVALAIGEPDGSSTVPAIWPVSAWPQLKHVIASSAASVYRKRLGIFFNTFI
jgi:hypothetical protein